MDCNMNQAKCKGGLCIGCYKKQGHEGMKRFCVVCFKIGKKFVLIMRVFCVKIASGICLSGN